VISSLVPTASRLPGIDLRVDGKRVTIPLLELTAHLGADRPDRIEATLRLDATRGADAKSGAEGEDPSALRPGLSLALAIGGTPLSVSVVERVAFGWSSSGRALTVVAYAEYQGRRQLAGPLRYFEATDGEIASDVATRLGLVARVDPTAEVWRRALVEGDPLRDLRRRARARGFHLAVADGRLHFAADIPSAPTALRLGSRGGILALEIVDRAGRGRGGCIEVVGDPRLRPLAGIELSGVDPRTDGRYRVVRAVHRIDAEGYIARVEILEAGLDFTAWSDGREGGVDGPGA
jgi:hypothetical protein